MPQYNFKKKIKFYVVSGGLKYLVDVYPDVSFSQTFEEGASRVKTLHTQTDMFERAIITEANPANFNFTMPIWLDPHMKPVLNLLLDYDPTNVEVALKTVDIYVDTGVDIFKLEKAVFAEGVFSIAREQIVTLSISGSASKLTRFGPSGTAIPGTLQPSGAKDALAPWALEVRINNIVQPYITSVSLEVRNEIQWIDNNNLHKSLAVTSTSDTSYPEAFVVSKRLVAGVVQQYVTDETRAALNSWSIGSSMSIKVGRPGLGWTLTFDLPSVVYTNRLEVGDLFIQSYDYRLISNPTDLKTVITQT